MREGKCLRAQGFEPWTEDSDGGRDLAALIAPRWRPRAPPQPAIPVGQVDSRDDTERASCERHRQSFAEGDRRFNGDGWRYWAISEAARDTWLRRMRLKNSRPPHRQAEDRPGDRHEGLKASRRNAGSRRAVPRAPSRSVRRRIATSRSCADCRSAVLPCARPDVAARGFSEASRRRQF